jgi:hypothetical protein
MYKRPGWVYQFLTKMSTTSSSFFAGVHVGDSASTNVCHQPHDTFSGRYASTGTMQGTFLSIESPRPSCPSSDIRASFQQQQKIDTTTSSPTSPVEKQSQEIPTWPYLFHPQQKTSPSSAEISWQCYNPQKRDKEYPASGDITRRRSTK